MADASSAETEIPLGPEAKAGGMRKWSEWLSYAIPLRCTGKPIHGELQTTLAAILLPGDAPHLTPMPAAAE